MSLAITLDFSDLQEYVSSLPMEMQAPVRMKADQAIEAVGWYIKDIWTSVTYGHRLPMMHKTFFDPEYGKSLRIERTGYELRVYTDYHGAQEIQYGRPSVDLKPGLLSGPNARTSKEGYAYNIIPFRHLSPSSRGTASIKPLPEDVYRAALRGEEIPANSEMGMRNIREGWKVGPYAHLRREQQDGARSSYRTYRTVSQKHAGTQRWVIPQMPPIDVVGAVQNYVQPHVQEIVSRYI